MSSEEIVVVEEDKKVDVVVVVMNTCCCFGCKKEIDLLNINCISLSSSKSNIRHWVHLQCWEDDGSSQSRIAPDTYCPSPPSPSPIIIPSAYLQHCADINRPPIISYE